MHDIGCLRQKMCNLVKACSSKDYGAVLTGISCSSNSSTVYVAVLTGMKWSG